MTQRTANPCTRVRFPVGPPATSRTGTNLVLGGRREGGALVRRLKENGQAEFPFSLRRIADYPKPKNRIEAWTQDLDALEKRFLPVGRSFSLGERLLFLEALSDIPEDPPKLSDAPMPIRLQWFSDGLYVVRA